MTTFKQVIDEMNELYERKNHDYGDSFTDTYKKFGLISPLARIHDKMNRAIELCMKSPKVADESMRDTLIDLANYAVMTILVMENEKNEADKETDKA